MGKAVLIVIDEFSNQAPWHLAKFLKACQVLTNNYGVLFGGIPVIFAGDLNQLGPVKAGKSLASAIVDMCLNVWTISICYQIQRIDVRCTFLHQMIILKC
jgi:hypothetical protein